MAMTEFLLATTLSSWGGDNSFSGRGGGIEAGETTVDLLTYWGGAEAEVSIRGATGGFESCSLPFPKTEEASSDFFLRPAKARLSLMPPATAALKPLVAGDGEGRGGTGFDWVWPIWRGMEDERGAKDCWEEEEAEAWPAR